MQNLGGGFVVFFLRDKKFWESYRVKTAIKPKKSKSSVTSKSNQNYKWRTPMVIQPNFPISRNSMLADSMKIEPLELL